MNRYGMVLTDIGMNHCFIDLLNNYLRPIFESVYPELLPKITHCHPFIVMYRTNKQKDLGFHYDEAILTMNLCLGENFVGGDLYFKGIKGDPSTHEEHFIYSHVTGQAIVHRGDHMHGALPITEGDRTNLIIWYQGSPENK